MFLHAESDFQDTAARLAKDSELEASIDQDWSVHSDLCG